MPFIITNIEALRMKKMNRGYKPSKASKAHIDNLTPALQGIIEEGFSIANTRKLYCPDFSITDSLRTADEQFKKFMVGRVSVGAGKFQVTGKTITNCDGYKKISDHQKVDLHGKAMAFDFCAYVNGTDYDDSNMALIATCFYESASNQGHSIEWGGCYRSISDGSHVSLIV